MPPKRKAVTTDDEGEVGSQVPSSPPKRGRGRPKKASKNTNKKKQQLASVSSPPPPPAREQLVTPPKKNNKRLKKTMPEPPSIPLPTEQTAEPALPFMDVDEPAHEPVIGRVTRSKTRVANTGASAPAVAPPKNARAKKVKLIPYVDIVVPPRVSVPRKVTPGYAHSEQQARDQDVSLTFSVPDSRKRQQAYHQQKKALKSQKQVVFTEATKVAKKVRDDTRTFFTSDGPPSSFVKAYAQGSLPNVPSPGFPIPSQGSPIPRVEDEGGLELIPPTSTHQETPKRKDTPIESDLTPSDWEEKQAAAKRARAHKERRELSDTGEEDLEEDQELAGEVVVSPDGKQLPAEDAADSEGDEHHESLRQVLKLDKGKGKEVYASENEGDDATPDEPELESGEENDEAHLDNGNKKERKGKPGRKGKKFDSLCESFGQQVKAEAENIAQQYGVKTNTVMEKALLVSRHVRLNNNWNKFEQLYKGSNPKREGESEADFAYRMRADWEMFRNEDHAVAELEAAYAQYIADPVNFKPATTRMANATKRTRSLGTSISMSNPDIITASVVLYVGEDQAARQEASLVTSSTIAAELINENDMLVQVFINGLVDKLRAKIVDAQVASALADEDTAQIFTYKVSGPTAADDDAAPTEEPEDDTTQQRALAIKNFQTRLQHDESKTKTARSIVCASLKQRYLRLTKEDRGNFPWSTVVTSAWFYKFQVVNWPDFYVSYWPSLCSVNVTDNFPPDLWKCLARSLDRNEFALIPWTDKQKAIEVDSLEFEDIPLFSTDTGRVLARVKDVPMAARAKGLKESSKLARKAAREKGHAPTSQSKAIPSTVPPVIPTSPPPAIAHGPDVVRGIRPVTPAEAKEYARVAGPDGEFMGYEIIDHIQDSHPRRTLQERLEEDFAVRVVRKPRGDIATTTYQAKSLRGPGLPGLSPEKFYQQTNLQPPSVRRLAPVAHPSRQQIPPASSPPEMRYRFRDPAPQQTKKVQKFKPSMDWKEGEAGPSKF